METIQVKDILDIYKLCGLNGDENTVIRNSINLGTLKRRLNLETQRIIYILQL